MAEIIAVINQKGGVGKTTTVQNVGAYLASKGKKILLVDFDPQGNLSVSFGINENDAEFTILGALLKKHKVSPYNIKKNLDIVPASYNLSSLENSLPEEMEIDKHYLLNDVLKPIKSKLDYILIDCPPSLGLFTLNSLVAADKVLIPLDAHKFSIVGLNKVIEIVYKVNERVKNDLSIAGVVFTKYDKRKIIDRDLQEHIDKKFPGIVLKTTIRDNVTIKEASNIGIDVFEYDENSNGAMDYKNLVNELFNLKEDKVKETKVEIKTNNSNKSISEGFSEYLKEQEIN